MIQNLTSIQNIIFDLGGVILNIDPAITMDEMKKLGISNFDHVFNKMKENGILEQLEKGEITEEQFMKLFRQNINKPIEYQTLIDTWNLLLLDYPEERIELLDRLNRSDRYRTFLLSNTNIIHKKDYTRQLQEEFGIEGLEDLFEKAYFSHEIHMRKPDPEIFKFVLEDSGLKAEETLFIDDTKENIESAEKLGIQSCLVDQNYTIVSLFEETEARRI